MSTLKKYALHFLITVLSLLLTLLLITLPYYFNIINSTTYNILKIILLLLVLFINSYFLGKKAKVKGYLEGIKLALFMIFIFFLTALITSKSFELKYLLYYTITALSSIFGSMVGISQKKNCS